VQLRAHNHDSQSNVKSNSNRNPVPTTEQHAVVKIQVNVNVVCPVFPAKFIQCGVNVLFSLHSVIIVLPPVCDIVLQFNVMLSPFFVVGCRNCLFTFGFLLR